MCSKEVVQAGDYQGNGRICFNIQRSDCTWWNLKQTKSQINF